MYPFSIFTPRQHSLIFLSQICIFMGCVYAYVIILTFLGPEYKGRSMSARTDEDLAEATGQDLAAKHGEPYHRNGSDSETEKV